VAGTGYKEDGTHPLRTMAKIGLNWSDPRIKEGLKKTDEVVRHGELNHSSWTGEEQVPFWREERGGKGWEKGED